MVGEGEVRWWFKSERDLDLQANIIGGMLDVRTWTWARGGALRDARLGGGGALEPARGEWRQTCGEALGVGPCLRA